VTVKELKLLLAKEPDDMHVAVWLPGSRIDLAGASFTDHKVRELLIEGNVRDGSVLLELHR
jgi:hypothetical protein